MNDREKLLSLSIKYNQLNKIDDLEKKQNIKHKMLNICFKWVEKLKSSELFLIILSLQCKNYKVLKDEIHRYYGEFALKQFMTPERCLKVLQNIDKKAFELFTKFIQKNPNFFNKE